MKLFKIDDDNWINLDLISEIQSDYIGNYIVYLSIVIDGEQVSYQISKAVFNKIIKELEEGVEK